jgi:pfkB family carbohydrate kinase
LDSLLNEATIIFTNSDQIQDYLTRLNHELEVSQHRECLPIPSHVVVPTTSSTTLTLKEEEQARVYARAIQPSAYFTRWFPNSSRQKEVVITKGSLGALHVICDNIVITEEPVDDNSIQELEALNLVQVELMSSSNECEKKKEQLVRIRHTFVDIDKEGSNHKVKEGTKTKRRYSADYTLRSVGIVPNCPVVDTTGAGDAFIGGFVLARLCGTDFPIETCMKFGSWVGGQKIQGPGARSALPRASQANEMLGSSSAQVMQTLDELIGKFSAC